MSSLFLFVRLAAATGLVLAPGAIMARALGVRSTSATLACGLALVFGALGVTFAVHGSLTLALVLLAVAALVMAPFSIRRGAVPMLPGRAGVWLAGAIVGILLWPIAGEIGGDGLFHLARVRKLGELGDLSLSSVNEFADGGLHPGYAFPLWHGFLALVAKVAFVDPAQVVLHEPSVLAPLAALVAYEAGYAVFGRVAPAAALGSSRGRDRRDGTGTRRRLHRPRPSRHRGAPAARPRGARPRPRCDAPAVSGPARERRPRVPRPRSRSPDLRDLPLDSLRRVSRRPLGLAPRAGAPRSSGPRCARGARGPLSRVARPRRPEHRVGEPGRGRARQSLRPVRRAAAWLPRSLLARTADVRPVGGDRRGRTPARAAHGARVTAPLGCLRGRRRPRHLCDHAPSLALHPVLGPRIAVPDTAPGGVLPVRVRSGRWNGRRRLPGRPVRHSSRTGGRDRSPVAATSSCPVPKNGTGGPALPGDLRLQPLDAAARPWTFATYTSLHAAACCTSRSTCPRRSCSDRPSRRGWAAGRS